ncbi:ABC transporter permease [Nocardiopsis mangrovi]|uniref:ABC transporter permease n=1 Tax=Nocardiopsis mangrovi TaxID=1179818 RepID=A0ABV9DVF1_9ACTN
MTDTTAETPTVARDGANDLRPSRIDSRRAYLAFAFAFVFGHGAFAVSAGADPLMDLPTWVPFVLLATGIVPGVGSSLMAGRRAQRDADPADVLSEKLVGNAWATGFIAVTLAIIGLTSTVDLPPEVENVLFPIGAVFIVGMINIAEGAARRNVLHYTLGSSLALISTAALFLTEPGPYWVLALAGGSAYLIAAYFEGRRLAALG